LDRQHPEHGGHHQQKKGSMKDSPTRSRIFLWMLPLVLGSTTIAFEEVAYGQAEAPAQPERIVQDNFLHSSAWPEISVLVADSFAYLGNFEFTLKGGA
jgi:hypothetical protein